MTIHYWSAISFLAATAGFSSLGIAIYRRAKRNTEVYLLLWMLGIFSLQSALMSIDALLFGILGIMQAQAHVLFGAVENSLYLVAIGTVFHFVFLSFSKALDESGILTDPLSQLQNYKGQYWFWVLFIYSLPAASIGRYVYLVLRTWRANPSAGLVFPPMQTPGFLYVFNLCWFFLFALRALALYYQRIGSPKKRTMLDRLLAPLAASLAREHVFRLRLSEYRKSSYTPRAVPASQDHDERMAGLFLAFWLLVFMVVGFRTMGTFMQQSEGSRMLEYLLPSVFIVPLVYYKMRFVFFDVLIRRGLIAVTLLVSGALYFRLLLIPASGRLVQEEAAAAPFILYAGTMLFVIGWLAMYGRLNLMLDRRLFRRSDYGKAISEIDLAMRQFVEPVGLLEDVKVRLRSALDAESVEFIPSPTNAENRVFPEAQSPRSAVQRQLLTAEIPVSTPEKSYGSLRFGRRAGSLRYQSEDLAFMTAIATHLAQTFRNFELSAEREAQKLREQHLRALAQQAELRALRAQINPHFLFNALNGLADLAQEDPKATEEAILNLSHVFRYVLDASQHESVILDEELSFVESYLAIERLRFEDGLRYEIEASAEARSCRRLASSLREKLGW